VTVEDAIGANRIIQFVDGLATEITDDGMSCVTGEIFRRFCQFSKHGIIPM
jgi:hypothetical protein